MSIPRKLYKYASLSGPTPRAAAIALQRAKRLILERELWFSAVTQFNDPFECRFTFTIEGTRDQWLEFAKRQDVISRIPGWAGEPLAFRAAFLRNLCSGRSAQAMSFPEAFRSNLAKDAGILCLSAKCDDLLMWAHYADSHRGVCYEFTPHEGSLLFSEAEDVKYQDDYPSIDYFGTTEDQRATIAMCTKSTCWAYEQEWRVIDVEAPPGIRYYAPGELTGIIFGCEIAPDLEAKLRCWCQHAARGAFQPIALSRAQLRSGAFALDIVPA